MKSTNKFTSAKGIHFSNAAKTLLTIGTHLIRGNTETISEYSLENAWKYPDYTVQHLETAATTLL